ncbi:MAG: hypothetical protein WBO97_11960 [Tepidiformaceae bacterium]
MLFAPAVRRILLLAMLPIASLSFACSSSTKAVALDDWVDGLCEAAADFQDAATKGGKAFAETDTTDTKAAKKAFADSVEEQKKAQKDFRASFDKLGEPDVEDGDKVVKAFKDQFKANSESLDDFAATVADIDNNDDFEEGFFDALGDFNPPDFRSSLEDLADDSDGVQDVIDAIEDDPDCAVVIFQDGDGSASDDTDDKTTDDKTAAPKTTNEKWVAGICTAFGDWVDDVGAANVAFQARLDDAPQDGAAIKKILVEFLKTAQADTENLDASVGKLKAPDVKDGAKIHKVFTDASGNLVEVFDDLVARANKIDVSNASRTLADVDALAESIDGAFEEASAGFDKLDTFDAGELEDLFDSRPECSGP